MAIDNYEVRFNTTGAPVTEADLQVGTDVAYGTSGGSKSVTHTHGQASGTVYYGVRSHDPDTDLYSEFKQTSVQVPAPSTVSLTYATGATAGFVVDANGTVDWGLGAGPVPFTAGTLLTQDYTVAGGTAVVVCDPGFTSFAFDSAHVQPVDLIFDAPTLEVAEFSVPLGQKSLASVAFTTPSALSTCRRLFDQQFQLVTVTGLPSTTCQDFAYMFSNCASLTSVPALATSQGTDFSYLFGYCPALTSVPDLDTSQGTDFGGMFYYCESLTSIPGLDTSAGTDFSYMFSSCTVLTSVPALDTSLSTDFGNMFWRCTALTSIPDFVTSAGTDFYAMFALCTGLTSIPALDTSAGINFRNMFDGCTALTVVPALDVSLGTDFTAMFAGCTALTSVLALGFRYSVSVAGTALDAAALNTFFTNLGTADNSVGQQTVDITGCPGAATCDRTIATAAKGWTVTG